MAKAKHYCCTSRAGVYSPEEPARRTTPAELSTLRPGTSSDDLEIPIPDEDRHPHGRTESPPKSRLSSRLKERLSFGQHSRTSRVLIKTPRKEPPKLRKASLFEGFLGRPSMHLDLDDQRTPSRGGYDADARLIPEIDLLENALISASELIETFRGPDDTCHTDVTKESSGDATISSNGLSLTTPDATLSSTPDSHDGANSSQGSDGSIISIWSETTGEVQYFSRHDHCMRLPKAPQLELRSFSRADLSMEWSATSSNADKEPKTEQATQDQAGASVYASRTGQVLWDAEVELGCLDDDQRESHSGSLTSDVHLTALVCSATKPRLQHPEDDSNPSSPRSSVHLNDMRISQHLRSMSSLSKDSFDVVSGNLRHTPHQSVGSECPSTANSAADVRKESFQSETVPRTWGRVVSRSHSPQHVQDVIQLRSAFPLPVLSLNGLNSADSQLSTTILSTDVDRLEPPCQDINDVGRLQQMPSGPQHSLRSQIVPSRSTPHLNTGSAPHIEWDSLRREPINDVATTSPCGEKRKSFGSLLDRNKLFDHAPKFRLKIGKRKSKASFDGTSDSPSPSAHLDDDTVPTVTVGSNYEETSNVWEKALNAHRFQVAEGKSNSPRAPHRMSFSAVRKSRLSTAVAPDEPTKGKGKARRSIGFKPMEVEHSFDRLAVPGQPTLVRARRLTESFDKETSGRRSLHGRKRSRSQPALKSEARGRERQRKADRLHRVSSFDSNTARDTSATVRARRRPTSALDTWSRYPSHTRSNRSLSAGAADGVLTRDFAQSSNASDEESQLDPAEKKQRQKHRHTLARRALIRKTLLTDLPALFKPFTSGFRKGESGHRSSIAIGGTLEYPELELLPAGDDMILPAANESSPISAGQNLEASGDGNTEHLHPLSSIKTRHLRPPTIKRHVSTANSSMYDASASDYNNGDKFSQASSLRAAQHLSASDWSQVYGNLVTDIGTDFRKSMQGDRTAEATEDATIDRPLLASTTSMPALAVPRTTTLDLATRSKLAKSCSLEPVRLSTRNLIDMLDKGLEGDIARALRSAEMAWKDISA